MDFLLQSHLIESLELTVLGRLILASILGGAIGFERELSGKEAGLRTNLLICIGACLLTILSLRVGNYLVETDFVMADPSRLMAAVISGIGFLGAGTIIQARGSITGLTTAATLWVVAAIGIAVGAGVYVIASGSAFFVLAALIPLGIFEGRFLESPHHWIKATIRGNLDLATELNDRLEERNFEVVNTDISLVKEDLYDVLFEVEGKDRALLEGLTDLNQENSAIEDIVIVPGASRD